MANGDPNFKAGEMEARLSGVEARVGEVLAWCREHDREEFGWHARLEAHLSASSAERIHTATRIDRLDADLASMRRKVETLERRAMMAIGALAIIGPTVTLLAQAALAWLRT